MVEGLSMSPLVSLVFCGTPARNSNSLFPPTPSSEPPFPYVLFSGAGP